MNLKSNGRNALNRPDLVPEKYNEQPSGTSTFRSWVESRQSHESFCPWLTRFLVKKLLNVYWNISQCTYVLLICFTLQRLVVTICTTRFTVHKFYVLPTQCMCFVWISEQTAIISLYSINWLVCITEMECVYCAVWTVSLNTVEVNPAKDWVKNIQREQWQTIRSKN
jgi:hypothetical protein